MPCVKKNRYAGEYKITVFLYNFCLLMHFSLFALSLGFDNVFYFPIIKIINKLMLP